VGCLGRKAAPKQAENVLTGSIIPISVPATLAVYPAMKWYILYAESSLATGGNTPNESQVRNITFLG